jgi:hypothetical protein
MMDISSENEFWIIFEKKYKARLIINWDEIKKNLKEEMNQNQSEKSKLEHSVTVKHKEAILARLNEFKIKENASNFGAEDNFAFEQNPDNNKGNTHRFRLDNPIHKGKNNVSGHWEIQINGITGGKTTVALAKAPDSIRLILNKINDKNLEIKYVQLLCDKLIESLNSLKNQEIEKKIFNYKDLKNLFE